ncbi:hypothetical protein JCM8547_007485 [Rhodosporidiobolus lusitaniae]
MQDPTAEMLSRGIEALFGPRMRLEKANREEAERIFGSGRPWPMTSLPPELLVKIINRKHPHPDDLAKLCRTSKALQPHAQYALYSEAVFLLQDDEEHDHDYFLLPRERNLLRSLRTCSNFAELVVSLELRIETADCPDLTAKAFGLSLGGVDYDKYHLSDEIVHTKRISFLDLSIVSQIKELEVDSIFLLASLSNLKHLTGGVPSFEREVTDDDVLAWPEPPVLQSFKLYYSNATHPIGPFVFVGWLLYSSDEPPHAQPLRPCHRQAMYSPMLEEILETLPPTLTTLRLKDWTRVSKEAVPYEKHYLLHLPPFLRRLELSLTPYHPSTVLSLVENIPSALPGLEVFELAGKSDDGSSSRLLRDPSSKWKGEDWEKLEESCRENGIRCKI